MLLLSEILNEMYSNNFVVLIESNDAFTPFILLKDWAKFCIFHSVPIPILFILMSSEIETGSL